MFQQTKYLSKLLHLNQLINMIQTHLEQNTAKKEA